MFKKLNKKGFTLAELLVVVAIIGVLVAISIPVFTSQIEKAREAVDISNMRAAYAVGMSDVLTKGYEDSGAYTAENGKYTGYYTTDGSMQKDVPGTAYGKATKDGYQSGTPDWPSTGFTYDGKAAGKVIKVVITPSADVPVAISWVAK